MIFARFHCNADNSDSVRAARSMLARVKAFRRDRSGAATMEFVFVAPIFLLVLFFILSIGYVLVMAQSLDYATQKSARQIATGQAQAQQLTKDQYRKTIVCPLLPSMFNCNNVIVNVQSVPTNDGNYPNEYYNFVNTAQTALLTPPLDNTQTTYCPGNAQNYVYVQVLYPVSSFLSFLVLKAQQTFNGAKVYVISATATFLNEPFIAPVSPC